MQSYVSQNQSEQTGEEARQGTNPNAYASTFGTLPTEEQNQASSNESDCSDPVCQAQRALGYEPPKEEKPEVTAPCGWYCQYIDRAQNGVSDFALLNKATQNGLGQQGEGSPFLAQQREQIMAEL